MKYKKTINMFIILFILFILTLSFAIYSNFNKTSLLKNENLIFTFKDCNTNFVEETENFNLIWTNSSLDIKTNISINCAQKILDGNYKIEKENLTLYYTLSKSENLAKCSCIHELNYDILEIEKKDYEIKLKSIN